MKTIDYLKICTLLFSFFLLSGCVTSMKMAPEDLKSLSSNEGIIVGSLNVTGGEDLLGRVEWALIAKNNNDSGFAPAKKYSITAMRDKGEEIFVSKMPVGNYTFYELSQSGFSSFKAKTNIRFTVQPGKVVYIGRLLIKFPPGFINMSTKIHYKVEDAKDTIIENVNKLYGIDLENSASILATTN